MIQLKYIIEELLSTIEPAGFMNHLVIDTVCQYLDPFVDKKKELVWING